MALTPPRNGHLLPGYYRVVGRLSARPVLVVVVVVVLLLLLFFLAVLKLTKLRAKSSELF